MSDVTIWHNPRCSKSRATLALLEERGVDATEVRYLDDAPSRADLERVLSLLGTDDPTTIARRGEDRWKELDLEGRSRDELLDAMAANPILIERPIVIRGERAAIGRPPENVLSLLDD
jgi:arsenate reductase